VRKLRTALNDPMYAVWHVFITALEMFDERTRELTELPPITDSLKRPQGTFLLTHPIWARLTAPLTPRRNFAHARGGAVPPHRKNTFPGAEERKRTKRRTG
jgi:hypothetical protein